MKILTDILPSHANRGDAALQLLRRIMPHAAIAHTAAGAPYIADDATHHISISHCPGVIALAVAGHPVGIDVERPRPTLPALVRRVASPDGDILPPDNDIAGALRLWTAKEAAFKCSAGTPFPAVVLSDITLAVDGSSLRAVIAGQRFRITHRTLPGNVVMAVAEPRLQ